MPAPSIQLSAGFVRNVTGVFGDRGRDWLAGLPALLEEFAGRWNLHLEEQAEDLSFNYVIGVRLAGGEGAVLKLGVPNKELKSEAAALSAYGGQGAVRLIDSDAVKGVLLLERVAPGKPMWDQDDETVAPVVASVMKELWRPAPPDTSPFPTLDGWMRGFDRLRSRFDGGTGPLPGRLVERAERLYAELASGVAPVLLHGDLHHGNVLSATRAPWLAIDPKGVIGAPGFEVGAFMRNPIAAVTAATDPASRVSRRIAILSEHLGFERRSIRDWAFVQSMLSAWWSVEDSGGWEQTVELARVLERMEA